MLLWWYQSGADRYELRRAGRSLRLYTNGVFHSQFNPDRPVGGGVWDLLWLPAFALPRAPRRVLVLGVGGGAVLRQLDHFFAPELMVGVELDPVHLEVARRWFELERDNVCLVQADARRWLSAYRGPGFDLVIDDLFGHIDGEARRAVTLDEAWVRGLRRLLRARGALVVNAESARQLRAPALVRAGWAEAQRFTTPHYENAVGAFFPFRPDWRAFEARLRARPELDRRRADCRLRYTRRRLVC